MSAITLGPFEGVSVLGSAIALPPKARSTQAALSSVPAGQRMSPERRAHIAQQLDQWLGLGQRSWSYEPGDAQLGAIGPDTAQLAHQALERALDESGLSAKQLALLLVATSTPHRYTGTVSSHVSQALHIQAPCLDLRAGCSAALFGLAQAALYLRSGAQAAAIVGADTFSAVLPPEHHLGVCAMGDGAAALVLGRGSSSLLATTFESDGSYGSLVSTPGAMPPNQADLERGAYKLTGDMERFDEEIPKRYAQAITRVLEHAQISPAQIDWFIPNQTSLPALLKACERAHIDPTRLWSRGISAHANIGAAGWIAGLSGAIRAGDIQPGQLVLSASVGGGMSWGAALWRF